MEERRSVVTMSAIVRSNTSRLVAGLLALNLITACDATKQAYEGPKLGEAKESYVIRISGFYPGFPSRPYFSYVDELDGVSASIDTKRFAILPGQHVALVRIHSLSDQKRSIEFSAREGHVYLILGYRKDEQVFIWVQELETNDVVAGDAPPGLYYRCALSIMPSTGQSLILGLGGLGSAGLPPLGAECH